VNKIPPVARGLGKPNHVKSCVLPVFRFFFFYSLQIICVCCLFKTHQLVSRAGFNTRTQIASRATQQQNHRRYRTTAAVQCRSEPPFSADRSAQRSRCRECCRRYCKTDLGRSEISCTWYLI